MQYFLIWYTKGFYGILFKKNNFRQFKGLEKICMSLLLPAKPKILCMKGLKNNKSNKKKKRESLFICLFVCLLLYTFVVASAN